MRANLWEADSFLKHSSHFQVEYPQVVFLFVYLLFCLFSFSFCCLFVCFPVCLAVLFACLLAWLFICLSVRSVVLFGWFVRSFVCLRWCVAASLSVAVVVVVGGGWLVGGWVGGWVGWFGLAWLGLVWLGLVWFGFLWFGLFGWLVGWLVVVCGRRDEANSQDNAKEDLEICNSAHHAN